MAEMIMELALAGLREKGRADGLFQRKGLYDLPPLRLRDLGKHPEDPRYPFQGTRPRKRIHADVHSGIPSPEGKGPR